MEIAWLCTAASMGSQGEKRLHAACHIEMLEKWQNKVHCESSNHLEHCDYEAVYCTWSCWAFFEPVCYAKAGGKFPTFNWVAPFDMKNTE